MRAYKKHYFYSVFNILMELIKNDEPSSFDEEQVIEKHYPLITRKTCSKYEYARVVTALAKYIGNHTSLKDIIHIDGVDNIIFNVKLAVDLLKSKIFDAQLDRGYEIVTFSTLDINPRWESEILEYYSNIEKSMNEELFEPLNIVKP
jgi:hypothetical protein